MSTSQENPQEEPRGSKAADIIARAKYIASLPEDDPDYVSDEEAQCAAEYFDRLKTQK